jgi:signal recognition particle receptor subunit beta
MVSLNTETDRTLFFDLLPMDIGVVGGFKTKLQLYTVPGQVFYNSTRKLVLKGVDGIVFVADSQTPMLDANKESLQNLDDNLRELGLDIRQIPMVFQWNKRDLKNVVPIEQMESELNPRKQPSFQSVASDGTGVFETLRGITKLALGHIKAHHFADTGAEEVPQAVPETHPTPPPPPPVQPIAEHPEVLTLSDLPSVGELLEDEAYAPSPTPSAPTRPLLPKAITARIAPPPRPAPAPIKPMVPVGMPAKGPALPKPVAPKMVNLAPPALPKPKALPLPSPKATVSPVLGDMGHLGGMSASSVLKLDLPANLDAHDLEIIVQVRQSGHVVTEGMIKKAATTTKFSVELKRS